MIRINLLPQAKKAARAPSTPGSVQAWAIVYFVAALLWIIGLVGVYVYYDGVLSEQQSTNQALSMRIDQLRTKSAQLEDIRAEIAKSRELEDLVGELNRARMGPTRVMMELSQILSVEGGPTVDPQELEQLRRVNPLAGFNRSWDPRRLWLVSFEEDSRECRIQGVGKTNEDVAEFLRRLALSEVFERVTLTKTESAVDSETDLTFISFDLTCRVRY